MSWACSLSAGLGWVRRCAAWSAGDLSGVSDTDRSTSARFAYDTGGIAYIPKTVGGSASRTVRPGRSDTMGSLGRALLAGAAAGAAGTTALNGMTYLDMAVRGRPASSTPEDTVNRLAGITGLDIPGEGAVRQGRLSGLAALTGLLTGVSVGALAGLLTAKLRLPLPVLSLLIGTAAMVGSNVPMTALGVTDPRSWDATSWLSDVIPHLAYGAVTAAVLTAQRKG